MAEISYERAWQDHRYLWETYGPAADMTGAYVDQGDLAKLLQFPTKATARACLIRQICYWFDKGTDEGEPDWSDPRLRVIARRYGASESLLTSPDEDPS